MSNLALLTDLYELTMIHGYFWECPKEEAVFEMFFRRSPFESGFAVFAGLDPLLDALENLHFTAEDIDYLHSLNLFRKEFLEYLRGFSFQGDIYSLREGTVVFPTEPILRIAGNIMEVQLVESLLLNFVNFQTLIATKTARIVLAGGGLPVVEFGLRRAQGTDGALSATRASFVGGASGTSNVMGGRIYGIPVKGTMAHSWVMNFPSELEAFEKYAGLYPKNCILLVDTYDTLKSGMPNAIKVLRELDDSGRKNSGIRLDSGDLEYLSKEARRMLDGAGLAEVKIVASNELDEWIISQLRNSESPIDIWGVGTKLVTGDKDPALGGVYKMVAKKTGAAFVPCIKISNNPEKITTPGIHNVFRFFDSENLMVADLIFLEPEGELEDRILARKPITFHHPNFDFAHFSLAQYARAEKLLVPVMQRGKRVGERPSLSQIQLFTKSQLASLHPTYKRLLNPHLYKVSLSMKLKELKNKMIQAAAEGRGL